MSSAFPKGSAWINNEFVDISEAQISILDWGLLRSDATYDVVHVWNNRFFLLDKHLDRFFESTKKLKMPCKLNKKQLKKILATCVKKSGLRNSYVEIIQTRGMSSSFDRDPRKAIPKLMAFAVPFGWILKPTNFNKGLSAVVTKIQRIPSCSIDPTIKNYHWLDLISGMYEAYEKKSDVGILVDQQKNILEGPGFNIFLLNKGGLVTPKKGVLLGITRSAVVELAKELGLSTKFKKVSLGDLNSSLEVFATSTAGGVMPITKINNKKISKGRCGLFTKKLSDLYWSKHLDPNWSCSVNDLLL